MNRLLSLCIGTGAAIALHGCGASPSKTAQKAEPELIASDIGNSIFVATVPDGIDAAKWPAMAKTKCGAEPFCQVYFWKSGVPLPGAMPFTEPEVAGIVYRYAINRSTGYEQSMWDCKTMPQADPVDCLTDDE